MTISPLIVKPWVEEIVSLLQQYHPDEHIEIDEFNRHFRIWRDDVLHCYVQHSQGKLYRPCVSGRGGPHKRGYNAGVIYDLTKENQRTECYQYVKDHGECYGEYTKDPTKSRTQYKYNKSEGKYMKV